MVSTTNSDNVNAAENVITLASLLESKDSRRLEAKIGLEILGNLTNETLERELADEEIRALLVLSDFTESDSSGPETMGLLDTTSRNLRNFGVSETPSTAIHTCQ